MEKIESKGEQTATSAKEIRPTSFIIGTHLISPDCLKRFLKINA
jgi:hypothetical protein